MFKLLRWIGYASTAVGVAMLIWACISAIYHVAYSAATMKGFIHHPINLFSIANSFFLLAIALFILTKHCCCDKCCETDEGKKEE
jgi:hypothetical protein